VTYDFVTKLSATPESLEVLGYCTQNKSYLYIDDSINPLLHVEAVRRTSEVFNVGTNDRLSVLDIANIVINKLSLDNVIKIYGRH
jgi:UDP-glucose 4-epimerase